MENTIHSFSAGSSVFQGKFSAVILKFMFTDGSTLLSAWDIEGCMSLVQLVSKQIEYLTGNNIGFDGDAVESVMTQDAPECGQADVDLAVREHGVRNVSGRMDAAGNLHLSLHFDNKVDIIVPPDYAEWLYGYVVNIVEDFDGTGSRKDTIEVTH